MAPSLEWGVDGRVAVGDVEELKRLLESLRQQAGRTEPFVVELFLDSGDALGMGLGRPVSLLCFVSASKEPPFFISRGDPALTPGDYVVFSYGGEPTEFPATAAISSDSALSAMIEFFETRKLPESIGWVID